MADVERPWLSAKEVAEIVGVHPDTVRNEIHRGHLPGTRFGHQWRILRTDVEKYLAEHSNRKGEPGVLTQIHTSPQHVP